MPAMTTPAHGLSPNLQATFAALRNAADAQGRFAPARALPRGIELPYKLKPDEAAFRIVADGPALYIEWVSPDRYFSQSIEADLMWSGDDLAEIIDEELADSGWLAAGAGPMGTLEHFRSPPPDKLFTFRQKLPIDPARLDPARDAQRLLAALHAYEAAFRELGDMKP
ncbi:MAG: hypothetical protein IBJ11_12555, partial [Phycisphaerales bacterium]|nr:hypothetical protein [Phycisphaerales bacterium]